MKIDFGFTVRFLGHEQPFLKGGSDLPLQFDWLEFLFGLLEDEPEENVDNRENDHD